MESGLNLLKVGDKEVYKKDGVRKRGGVDSEIHVYVYKVSRTFETSKKIVKKEKEEV